VDKSYLVFRCKNGKSHIYKGKAANGNIVAFVGENSIIVRCPDYGCKHWNAIEFSFPGFNIDLRKVGIVQTVVDRGINLETKSPLLVIGD
jgi:hypothetical protein